MFGTAAAGMVLRTVENRTMLASTHHPLRALRDLMQLAGLSTILLVAFL